MENASSPIETLRQLKEMLDAGTITPIEFEVLKQKLVFASVPPTPAAPAFPDAGLAVETPTLPPAASALPPSMVENSGPVQPVPAAPGITSPVPETVADWPEAEPATSDLIEELEPLPARNPLNLILSIGGLLALLGLVLYLSLNRSTSEHLTSTSQTAAESLAATHETGPQAIQPAPTIAAPETVRLTPTSPAPRVNPAASPAVSATDSVATAAPATPAPVADSAAGQ